MGTRSCNDCRHYHHALSQCRVEPPRTPSYKDGRHQPSEGFWPIVGPADWCGSFVSPDLQPPSDRCPGVFALPETDADPGLRIQCGLTAGHGQRHRADVEGTQIYWTRREHLES